MNLAGTAMEIPEFWAHGVNSGIGLPEPSRIGWPVTGSSFAARHVNSRPCVSLLFGLLSWLESAALVLSLEVRAGRRNTGFD